MPITEILAENARRYGDDVALVEINPEKMGNKEVTWREYSLIETSPTDPFRSELTWTEFDRKANRLANFLLTRNVKKGDKVAILLMNCLEWLPIYFGVLRAGSCRAVYVSGSAVRIALAFFQSRIAQITIFVHR